MDKKEEMGVVNNQTDSWKFKFEKLLNNATYETFTLKILFSQDEVYETSA